ncbi:lachesin-like [Planococcus citri]|uniref:lachesin-like n=1 Tax=Planococcus citri TaxID=170843 RepID=UPI0031F81538
MNQEMELLVLANILMFSTSSVYGYHLKSETVMPEFYAPLENLTATQGRDVQFTCVVNHLGDYRVAWIKSDSKAILAIHNRLVAHNSRLSVTHNGHNTWKLHILNIQKNDSGSYMCQINTDPMRWQLGYLNVTIPPDILNDDEGISDGYQALEGGSIHLRCKATGEPEPEVSWKREDGKPIVLRTDKQMEFRDVVVSENLTLSKVNRSDMGTYLCLAKSPVPPIMSKRFTVRVNFKPVVEVDKDHVGAPAGRDVKISCKVEASPKATFQWLNNRGEPIMPNPRVNITETPINEYTTDMELAIKSLHKRDFGEYTCVSENTIGRAEGKIRLIEISLPVHSTRPPPYYPPKKEKELPNVHKHTPHHKSTKTPHKSSKSHNSLDNNDINTDIQSTSISQSSSNENYNSQSVTEYNPKFAYKPNNGAVLSSSNSSLHEFIILYYSVLLLSRVLYTTTI